MTKQRLVELRKLFEEAGAHSPVIIGRAGIELADAYAALRLAAARAIPFIEPCDAVSVDDAGTQRKTAIRMLLDYPERERSTSR